MPTLNDNPIISNTEFKAKLKAGWLFPAALAKRWGLAVVTIYAGVKSGRLICVRNVSGVVLLDPTQPQSGRLALK
jgi:hypothetical protein